MDMNSINFSLDIFLKIDQQMWIPRLLAKNLKSNFNFFFCTIFKEEKYEWVEIFKLFSEFFALSKQGRCIVFPNSHQHKLLQLINKSDSDIAIRKMLCFFIVNPDKRIISTAEVNDQNWRVVKEKIAIELQKIALRILGQLLPIDVAQKILYLAKVGFTIEQAQANRLGLMQYRRFQKDEMNRDVERSIDLCEH
eukprot:TRINITY_DN13953_c0_g1_i1.p1 TRINITY_DN13953_c0_g1~~TRINITY_DN13953_c0_g1_i1.p1  ORF type:complete len:194 (-),score=22.97 TRINITY_DN13953_c0_g1_i1:198-779(-)